MFLFQDGEETDPETDEANENYETLNLNSTTDMNNSALNWTLSSLINQEESISETLQENTAVAFCNEVRPTAQQFADLKDEANIDAFRKYLKVWINSNETVPSGFAYMNFTKVRGVLEDPDGTTC